MSVSPAAPPSRAPEPALGSERSALEWPRRAERVELVGPMQGMSYADRKWLICLDGSQYVQATELLYHLLLYADGTNPVDAIAARVATATGRPVSGDEIRWLVANKLAGSGLIYWPSAGAREKPGAASRRAQSASPVLAIKHRIPLLPYSVTAPATEVLHHLYWPPLIVLVALAAAAINAWIYTSSQFTSGIVTLLYNPELVLFLFAIDTVTRIFHELGHASALRRAGARHGVIGFALYVIFPVYYTDVTHAYRLSRAQRIRVDLGGIYFDLMSMIGLYAIYRFTDYTPLLLMITLIGLGILRQFTPFMRFDGYYLIADLMGVPEPMSLLAPFVNDHMPWRWGKPKRVPALRPLAVAILCGYVALIFAFLSRPLLLLGVAGGAMLQQLPRSGVSLVAEFLFAWRNHDVLTQVAATLELIFWALIPLGLGLFALGLFRLLARLLMLLARVAYARVRAQRPVEAAPAPAPAAALAPPRRPTPLDGLGRPVAQADRASLDEIGARIRNSEDEDARDLAQDVARTYGRRLDEMAVEMARMIEWTAALERERDSLRDQVRTLEETVTSLVLDLKRIGGEMTAAAAAADLRLGHSDAPGARASAAR